MSRVGASPLTLSRPPLYAPFHEGHRVRMRAIEPFYSTKAVGKGLGRQMSPRTILL
jgi:hypothetical protein